MPSRRPWGSRAIRREDLGNLERDLPDVPEADVLRVADELDRLSRQMSSIGADVARISVMLNSLDARASVTSTAAARAARHERTARIAELTLLNLPAPDDLPLGLPLVDVHANVVDYVDFCRTHPDAGRDDDDDDDEVDVGVVEPHDVARALRALEERGMARRALDAYDRERWQHTGPLGPGFEGWSQNDEDE